MIGQDVHDGKRYPVPAGCDGVRLDVFLAGLDAVGSRRVAKLAVDRGLVLVDGHPVGKAGATLHAGQVVTVAPIPPERKESLAERFAAVPDLAVLYEDPFVLVIDKPAGIPSHVPPGTTNQRYPLPTVSALAERHCGEGSLPALGGDDRPGIVHRLDKDTSGVMVLAKSAEAFWFLQSQFKARTVCKEYRCLSHGVARFDSDWIETAIAPHPSRNERMIAVREGGRSASTYYEVVERFDGFTHFRCLPRTGRTHQIRVHMQSIGHPLVGDRVYRSRAFANAGLPAGCPGIERQALHAHRLHFVHPYSREELSFSAPIPADMAGVLAFLRRR